jgi:hypothetical protein
MRDGLKAVPYERTGFSRTPAFPPFAVGICSERSDPGDSVTLWLNAVDTIAG